MVNNDDRLVYKDIVSFGDLSKPLEPGVYTIQAVLGNYPDVRAEAKLTVVP
jgi:hypothetical protein